MTFAGVRCVVITDVNVYREALFTHGDAFTGRPGDLLSTLFPGGKFGILWSDGQLWQLNRRFAIHTLREFGLGRNVMEVKIWKPLDDVLLRGLNVAAVAKRPYSMFDDLQKTIGVFL